MICRFISVRLNLIDLFFLVIGSDLMTRKRRKNSLGALVLVHGWPAPTLITLFLVEMFAYWTKLKRAQMPQAFFKPRTLAGRLKIAS